jgi:Flp pilus assembly protein TadG
VSKRTNKDDGAAAVEFALVLPLLLLLVSAIIDFGRIYFEQSTLSGAAREGVRLVALGKIVGPDIADAVDNAAGMSGLDVDVEIRSVVTTVETAGVIGVDVTLPACTVGDPVTVIVRSDFSFWTPLPALAQFTGVDTLAGKGVMRCGG